MPHKTLPDEQNKSNKNKSSLFCFFSGYAKNLNRLISIKRNNHLGTIELTLSILSGDNFSIGEYIQLNGVICEVIARDKQNITVSTTYELASNTSLENILLGSKLNLGRLAEKEKEHKELYTLHPTAFGKATFYKVSVLNGHQHTLKLDFNCSNQYADIIKEDQYMGLSGSSLLPREVVNKEDKIWFSIYCGKETREKTHFNENLEIGTEVDLVAPHKIMTKSSL